MREIWIHIHIPKCGGSTFVEILKESHGNGYVNTNSVLNTYQYTPAQVLEILNNYPTCTCLGGHKLSLDLPYDAQNFRFNVIAFVRNPVDRFISHYFYHRNHTNNLVPEAKSMGFDEYIDWALVAGHQTMYINGQIRFLTGDSTERSLGIIDDHIHNKELLLFPLAQFNDALVVLKKLFPAGFTKIFTNRKNISQKDQVVTQGQKERILEFCNLDILLYQKSEKLLRELKNQAFPDNDQYLEALHTLPKNSGHNITRRLFKKGANVLRRIAGILENS